MKIHLLIYLSCLLCLSSQAQNHPQKVPAVYVDSHGVMRWTDTREEASFFGTNYTLPFAHAYRAAGYKGVDRKAAIDKDVYHFSRLGFNAYRIHLWDVELTDEEGNLLENEHLELMDYLIARLKERNIHIVVTAQTNFGNGYPERNQPTGGFSYKYDKCDMHANPEAIAAQERYLKGLVRHVNPYTGLAYKDDPFVVGFEINNEPCHSGTKEEVEQYINRMLKALKQAGNRKPVFYNVSHNEQVVEAYYNTDIQGTTYQWYPIGLVAGHTRQGNFLPYVDRYPISFSANVKGFDKKARLVYEFDPADILYSYMYPAMVRSFRAAGFQWITQFAYDPIDIAYANTEYQTHFLNLAYTPRKALSMKIAAEAARTLKRGETYGTYPQDTLFGNGFRVSYAEDLSELDNGTLFYYSNTTATRPRSAEKLRAVAGCGSSPVVRYEGTGAYFIDRLQPGVWRLEVMPDAIVVNDPFAKPSPDKPVVNIAYGAWDMTLHLPDLGNEFTLTPLNAGNTRKKENIADGIIPSLRPGAYLLQRKGATPQKSWTADSRWENIRLGEYVAPAASALQYTVTHTPATIAEAGKPLLLTAEVAGPELPDSVIVYTDRISFWSDANPSIRMKRIGGYTYQASVPATEISEGGLRYNIVVCRQGTFRTYPAGDIPAGESAGKAGSPLDWDYTSIRYYETPVTLPASPVRLLNITDADTPAEGYSLPEWSHIERRFIDASPWEKPLLRFRFHAREDEAHYFVRTAIKDIMACRAAKAKGCTTLCIRVNSKKALPQGTVTGFVTSDGYTYSIPCPSPSAEGIIRIPLKELRQTDTALLPVAYPVFLPNYFHSETELPFRIEKAEQWELSFPKGKGESDRQPTEIEIGNVWLE